MSSNGKGKAVASGGGERKRGSGGDDDKTGGGNKKKNRAVLRFFEDAADFSDQDSDRDSDDSDLNFDTEDFMDEEYDVELKVKNDPPISQNVPIVPKEEDMDKREFDKMMEERYKNNPRFRYAEDADEAKRSMERNFLEPSAKDPTVWKVKCMVGRERHSAFCLMQKFVDLKSLGTKLQIISAFAIDHGFAAYILAVAPVPKNEVSHLISIRRGCNQVTEGTRACVKNGNYKGDLAQIVAVNDVRKKATVKLIPRIDFQALAQKFGGGLAKKKDAIPAPRLISSSELEEFRPLIQYRRDRDIGKMFGVLDEEELLKFKPSENNKSENLEWLARIYVGQKKKQVIGNEKGGDKGESSLSSGQKFELYNLLQRFWSCCWYGEDDSYKILKHGLEKPDVVTIALRDLKNGPTDMKFTALDHHKKTISVNDTVKVLEGPLKDRQGIVKQIYRGIIFIYDQKETEDGGYFCSKAQMCEKIKLSFDACCGKVVHFEKINQGDKDGLFFIGQTLRIRIGPLKGYLCQVLAIRYSDVTVKLGSQQKVLTVKSEHLSEVRAKSSAVSVSDEPGSSSFKPFDLSGTEGWTGGAGASTGGDGWNTGGLSTESAKVANLHVLKCVDGAWGSQATENQTSSWGAVAGDSWNKAASNIGSTSGASVGWGKATLPNEDLAGSSRGTGDNWGRGNLKAENSLIDSAVAWDKGKTVIGNQTSSWGDAATGKNQVDSWGKCNDAIGAGSWEKKKRSGTGEDCWSNKSTGWNQQKSQDGRDTWGEAAENQEKGTAQMGTAQNDSWGEAGEKWESKNSSEKPTEAWGKAGGGSTQTETEDVSKGSGWMKAEVDSATQTMGKNLVKMLLGGIKMDLVTRIKLIVGTNQSLLVLIGDLGTNRGNPLGVNKRGGLLGIYQTEIKSLVVGTKNQMGVVGQSSGWKPGENNSTAYDQGGGWGKSKGFKESRDDGWKPISSGGDSGSGWNKNWGADKEISGSGDKWNSGNPYFGDKSSCNSDQAEFHSGSKGLAANLSSGGQIDGAGWNAPKSVDRNSSSGWNDGSAADEVPGEVWVEAATGKQGKLHQSDWGAPKTTEVDQLSSWDSKVGHVDANQSSGSGNKSSWGTQKSSQEKPGWNQESPELEKDSKRDGNQESSWGNKSGWNSGSSDAGRNSDSAWGKKSIWNSESSNADGNQDSGWAAKSNWNSGSKDANQGASWAKKSNWNCGSSDANQESGWGKKSSWSSGYGDGNLDSSVACDDRGGFRGRGDRGGFGGRNGSDRGGYGGRGKSDTGGFGGRGGSDRVGSRGRGDRGGFGGGGRGRRDQNGGWSDNGSAEDSTFGWKNGANNSSGGWKNNGGGSSWNQGGDDKGQHNS
ncbi:hypothetical protein H0E87_019870 [Populus deltoides]|uniref:KOW domain-containing protein n=1 Tax=Populus deltoides TaxID=3696 RepID=A0A8T2XWY7_POPDE|nr:hypothetical protein H0E87_019870 [Populus deltoides]